MDRRKVGDVSKTLGIDPNTVRQWTDLFRDWLSESANPPPGATRYYTDDDLHTLAFIYRARRNDSTFPEIQEALNQGQHRITLQNLMGVGDSDLGGAGSGKQIVRYDDADKWVRLEGQLHEVKEERNHLRAALASEQQAHAATRERAAIYQERARLLEAPKEPPTPSVEPRSMLIWRWALLAVLVLAVALMIWQAVMP